MIACVVHPGVANDELLGPIPPIAARLFPIQAQCGGCIFAVIWHIVLPADDDALPKVFNGILDRARTHG